MSALHETENDRRRAQLAARAADTWHHQAACRGLDAAIFFIEQGGDARPAKDICRDCSVVFQCLAYALEAHEGVGVWGGKSAKERRDILRLSGGVVSDFPLLDRAMPGEDAPPLVGRPPAWPSAPRPLPAPPPEPLGAWETATAAWAAWCAHWWWP